MAEPTALEPVLCRDCLAWSERPASGGPRRCSSCHSPRLVGHAELRQLSIAHLDCDAFYASVEKRDDPSLRDRPVIVGGGRRGVVSAACYIARTYGVRSAMPMFKALKACPDAVVIRPNMEKYARVGREVRELMLAVTPLVEPLSIDEAFLDLTGTERLHKGPPAETLCRLVLEIERRIGVTASIGLSYNKFLAKVASDLDKPRGFALIGRIEAKTFLAGRPATTIWGVGKAMRETLERDGITTVGQLQEFDEATLVRRYGTIGSRLARFAQGEDDRAVEPHAPAKSVSCETTFEADLNSLADLDPILWRLSEELSRRLKRQGLAGATVVLKLKTADFRTVSRQVHRPGPTQLADTIYRAGRTLLEREIDGRSFRLIGIGVADLATADLADQADLADPDLDRRKRVENAIDIVRAKLGTTAIDKGRGFGKSLSRQGVSDRIAEPGASTADVPEPRDGSDGYRRRTP